MNATRLALLFLLLSVCATGCSFCFYESEIVLDPIPMPQVAQAEPIQPQSWSEAITATIRWLTGETEVRRAVVDGATKIGVPVKHTTRRRFFRFEK